MFFFKFLMDYNLFGMNQIYLEVYKFRKSVLKLDNSDQNQTNTISNVSQDSSSKRDEKQWDITKMNE